MKVKFFGNEDIDVMERAINNFIKDKKVIDVKYNVYTLFSGTNRDMTHTVYDRAMVIYEDNYKPKESDFKQLSLFDKEG